VEQVKNLVPTLQILDGHPLIPGKVKRKYEVKKAFSKVRDESVVEDKQDQAKEDRQDRAKKKIKSTADKPTVQGTKDLQDEDASDKPFVDMITAQSAETKRTPDVRQDSGVVAVIDVKKEAVGVWKRKRGIEALTALREPEIGTGGPSSWDTPSSTSDAAAAPVATQPPTTYSRWALKKK